MKKIFINTIAAVLVLLPSCVFAGYNVTPINLELTGADKVSSLTVRNENDYQTNFQLIVLKRSMEDGKEIFTETKDLTATPVIFKLPSGKSQMVRVMLKNAMYETTHKAYYVSIKELPHKKVGKETQIRFVSEFRVPVTIKGADEAE